MSGQLLNRGGASGDVVVIAASGTKSAAFNAREGIVYGVFVPAGFEGTALTFEVAAYEAGAFSPLTIADVLTVAAGGAYLLPDELAPFPFFKIVSNATETAARELRIVSKR